MLLGSDIPFWKASCEDANSGRQKVTLTAERVVIPEALFRPQDALLPAQGCPRKLLQYGYSGTGTSRSRRSFHVLCAVWRKKGHGFWNFIVRASRSSLAEGGDMLSRCCQDHGLPLCGLPELLGLNAAHAKFSMVPARGSQSSC